MQLILIFTSPCHDVQEFVIIPSPTLKCRYVKVNLMSISPTGVGMKTCSREITVSTPEYSVEMIIKSREK